MIIKSVEGSSLNFKKRAPSPGKGFDEKQKAAEKNPRKDKDQLTFDDHLSEAINGYDN